MGTITASTIITACAHTLQDSGHATWTRSELLGYLNDGQRDLCVVKPDALTVTRLHPLVAGTRQTIPNDGAAFVRAVRNMGGDGLTPGRAPRRFDIAVMDMQHPNWHADTADATVMEYGFDERDPKTFYVSPPQPGTGRGQLDIVFYGVPPGIAAEASAIVLDDIYSTALQHYVCYRAYLKQGELQNNGDAMAHRAEFLSLLGAKEAGEQKAAA